MNRAVTGFEPRSDRWRRHLLRLAVALPTIAFVVLAVVLIRPQPETPSRSVTAPGPTPDRHSAADAALRYTQELVVVGVRRPEVYGRRLHEIAAPGSTTRVREAFGSGAEEVRALVRGKSAVLRAAPIGYRIDAFNTDQATVSVWMVALAGGPLLEPTAQWRLLTVELRWTEAGWRVEDGHGGGGPSPRSPLPLLVAEAATFAEVRHVP